MIFQDAVNLVHNLWAEDARQSVCILGPPGVGKTAIGKTLARRMGHGALCEVLDLTSRLPEDLGGFPYHEGGQAQYATQPWMHRASLAERGIIVLDDLPAAMPSVAAAARQLVLDRRLHDVYLPPRVGVLVTGNRREDRSGASELPAHFRNAVLMLSIEPHLESWSKWYLKDPVLSKAPEVVSYLHYRPSNLSQLPTQADERGSFATPRSWEMLGRALGRMSDVSLEQRRTLAHGLVGEGIAHEFEAFLQMRTTVDIASVLRDPQGTLPNPAESLDTPDALLAVLTALPEYMQREMASEPDKKEFWVHKALKAISWVSGTKREYVAAALSLMGLSVPVSMFIRVLRSTEDADIIALREFVTEALS